jgi:hypothetical protein
MYGSFQLINFTLMEPMLLQKDEVMLLEKRSDVGLLRSARAKTHGIVRYH